ncbi:glycosyltransferase family 4 protein [Oligoflexus tunisiensis]|uniref:glycosyltransferase family 4 protein n=1 Tax=Oligoflexus tunisiensis TaxID=708132 RepID=UPI000B097209|nr:glycosyltransferase family 4 protein [Oligoflexus tunisiensis]
MRIAQVSPLEESVPPKTYGGTERVVAYLTEELVRQGHEVTLFASGDSCSSARLVAACPQALRSDATCQDRLALQLVQLKMLLDHMHEFDIVHFHIDYLHFPVMTQLDKAFLTTLHGRQDVRELQSLYTAYNRAPLVSISHAQRAPVPMANWVGTVHHGLPPHLLTFEPRPGRYLAFLGRISREKRVDRAIEIAKACRLPLRIAAKVDKNDLRYFEEEVRPLLDHPLIEFVGEISQQAQNHFLGGALALLFPIDWPEPFGLVMIEAMACGTPVIAFRQGSVPEVLRHGINGYVVNSIAEGVAAVRNISRISRHRCREEFLNRFTAERMTRQYVAIYEKLIAETAHKMIIPFNSGVTSQTTHFF